MWGNGVAFGVVFLVSGLSFSDVDLEDEPDVDGSPKQSQDTAGNDYDPFPGEGQWTFAG